MKRAEKENAEQRVGDAEVENAERAEIDYELVRFNHLEVEKAETVEGSYWRARIDNIQVERAERHDRDAGPVSRQARIKTLGWCYGSACIDIEIKHAMIMAGF